MALKIDGKEEYAILVNENRYEGELNSVEKVTSFLSSTYLNPSAKKLLGNQLESSTPKNEKESDGFRYELTKEEKEQQEKASKLIGYILISLTIMLIIAIMSMLL